MIEMPERVTMPPPTGDAFVDYLEIRIVQALCRQVGRTKEGNLFSFVMGMATARWIYLVQYEVGDDLLVKPKDYVATVGGCLDDISVQRRADLLSILPDTSSPAATRKARRDLQKLMET
jgi:hypothetical protein